MFERIARSSSTIEYLHCRRVADLERIVLDVGDEAPATLTVATFNNV